MRRCASLFGLLLFSALALRVASFPILENVQRSSSSSPSGSEEMQLGDEGDADETELDLRPDPIRAKAARWRLSVTIPADGGEQGSVPVGAFYRGGDRALYPVTAIRDALFESWDAADERLPKSRLRGQALHNVLRLKPVRECLVPHPMSDLKSASFIRSIDLSLLLQALGTRAPQRMGVREGRPEVAVGEGGGVCKTSDYAFANRRGLLNYLERHPTLVRDALLEGKTAEMQDLRTVALQVPTLPPPPSSCTCVSFPHCVSCTRVQPSASSLLLSA